MGIYQHFRKHEHPFVDQVLSWIKQVEETYIVCKTDFLDPREQQIISNLIGKNNDEIIYSFFGGKDNCERKRAIIAPYYEELTEDLFDVVLLEASYPEKFVSLAHRDVLGAFVSLGIDRKKVGDMIVAEDKIQLITTKDFAPYVIMNFNQVKNAKIKWAEQDLTQLLPNQGTWSERNVTVSSLRLDLIVKEIYQISRKDATTYITRGRVKVNFTDVDDPAMTVMGQDLISVRGFGRSKLLEINGQTRKEKIRIKVARLIA